VLAVWCELTELRSPWLEASEFRSSVNLGNIGRRAAANMPHPSETYEDAKGKVRRRLIPNDEPKPDDDWPLIPLPETIETLVLLGDGDSEPVRTRNAMLRGAKSYAALRLILIFGWQWPGMVLILTICVRGRLKPIWTRIKTRSPYDLAFFAVAPAQF